MDIAKALPVKKYAQALQHSRTQEWRDKRDQAIADINVWLKTPDINRDLAPALWDSYGKDGTTVKWLLRAAGIDFQPLSIDCGGELPPHWLCVPEIDKYFSDVRPTIWYRTEKRFIEIVQDVLYWGRLNDVRKKTGELIDFFDLGALHDEVDYQCNGRFLLEYAGGIEAQNVVYFCGYRAAEQMDRYYEIQRMGLWQRHKMADPDVYSYRGLPIGRWRDIDVWALLASENVPVSPLYSMHEVPQHGGKHAFPRTQYYCHAWGFNSNYVRWLQRYFPAQLKEIMDTFPEVREKFVTNERTRLRG